MSTSDWTLYDFRPVLEADDDGPVVEIDNANECRAKLTELSKDVPGVYFLQNITTSCRLKIGLGRSFGFLHWRDASTGRSGAAIAKPVRAQSSEYFVLEGTGEEHTPDELIAIDQVIAAVVHMLQRNELYPGVTWRMWDPIHQQWTETTAE